MFYIATCRKVFKECG